MGYLQQAWWIRILGAAVGVLILLELMRYVEPATAPAAEVAKGKYRLVDPESGISVGELLIEGGQTTLILRDRDGIPRFFLEVDRERGGLIRIQDSKGHWHCYPAPPPDDN